VAAGGGVLIAFVSLFMLVALEFNGALLFVSRFQLRLALAVELIPLSDEAATPTADELVSLVEVKLPLSVLRRAQPAKTTRVAAIKANFFISFLFFGAENEAPAFFLRPHFGT
jgi:hypothetical protein